MAEQNESGAVVAPDLESTQRPRKKEAFFTRLYLGNGALDIVGKRKVWYIATTLLFLICLGSMVFKGFELGIDFKGGTKLSMPTSSVSGPAITDQQVKDVYQQTLGKDAASVQTAGTGTSQTIQIRSEALNAEQVTKLRDALFNQLKPKDVNGQSVPTVISDSAVSGSWGGEITDQAIIALVVFLVLVTLFLIFYFEKWMALSALAALAFDLIVTAGVYSIVGFEVTPATVIGLLTILGFSLYDTVVVFDKVKENTRGLLGLTRRTYAEATNLAVNQTLVRSLNTSLIAVLPVFALLAIGVGLLGVGTLKDLALVQMTGMISGVFSSIFLASPLLVTLKLTEPKYQQQAQRVAARRANLARKAEAAAAGETFEPTDEDSLDAELRREQAISAASGVPGRTAKASDARRAAPKARPTGKRGR
ncbi:protein translocase subunit SecF [Crossiella sp. CA-258035]|uniref:protein translocase subunit SecF n=1 Tax=Crossiella sp. CA-258035 TaxID=2981138 RepID=UPI0024BD4599|nr:protein translocase subunit SecF [Crossiella sp. CA-258035]WHT17141.1 protein translocase subunit SecF [Crossiella sp. CA-258035]